MSESSWQNQRGSRENVAGHRIIEVVTVLLLGLATIGSAWCAYQASRWNGEETDAGRLSAVARVDGAREQGLATQIVAYDAAIVAQYATAVVDENEELQTFLRTSLMRPGFLPILDEWQAYIDETGEPPPNLLENEDYLDGLLAKAREFDTVALEQSLRAEEASGHSDDYVLTTLLMASALFFAGVTASFSSRFTRLILLTCSAVTLAYASSRLVGFPVA